LDNALRIQGKREKVTKLTRVSSKYNFWIIDGKQSVEDFLNKKKEPLNDNIIRIKNVWM